MKDSVKFERFEGNGVSFPDSVEWVSLPRTNNVR
jgi:hypothetical protein